MFDHDRDDADRTTHDHPGRLERGSIAEFPLRPGDGDREAGEPREPSPWGELDAGIAWGPLDAA